MSTSLKLDSIKPSSFAEVAQCIDNSSIEEDDVKVELVDHDEVEAILLHSGHIIVHSYGCNGPMDYDGCECDYYSLFYIYPPSCERHVPGLSCSVCKRFDLEWNL